MTANRITITFTGPLSGAALRAATVAAESVQSSPEAEISTALIEAIDPATGLPLEDVDTIPLLPADDDL